VEARESKKREKASTAFQANTIQKELGLGKVGGKKKKEAKENPIEGGA